MKLNNSLTTVVSANFTKGSPEGLFVSWGLMLVSKWPSTTEVLSLSSSIIHTSVVIPVPILRAY